MRVILLFTFLFIFWSTRAQETEEKAPFQLTMKMPEDYFKLVPAGISKADFQKIAPGKEPLIMTYFSPDCGHCQMEAQALADSISFLKGIQVIWLSARTPAQIKSFDSTYHLSERGIVVMHDPGYHFAPFFRVAFTPFTVLSKADGTIIQVWRKGASVLDLKEAAAHISE